MSKDYVGGFNDALLLILLANHFDSWDEALKRFDFQDNDLCEPIKTNLEKVRKIWENLTC